MGLDLLGVKGLALRIDAGGYHIRALIHVGQDDRRACGGLGVETRAPVAMTASSDLEVEGAVDPVLLSTEYRSQVFRHYCLHNSSAFS